MQTATCILCQERVNLLSQKLVSVQWIESKSGTLLTLPFHSDCYVRWYSETGKQAGQMRRSGQAGSTALSVPPTQLPAGKGGVSTPNQPEPAAQEPPEQHLSAEELQRLQRLRGKHDVDAQAVIERSDPSDPSDPSGIEAEQPDDQNDQAPEKQQHDDSHDVPPPHV